MILMIGLRLGVNAQSARNNELHLYGSVGVKFLQSKSFSYAANISPSIASAIGGGAIWQKSNFQFGGEFFYTNATKHIAGYRSAYSGVNINFVGGYRVDLDNTFRLSIQSGIGYSLNHMYISDESLVSHDHISTDIFHNNNYSIPVSVMLQRVHSRGTFMGLKVGYNFNINTNHWKYMEGTTTHHFTTGSDGLFVQLILGGLMQLE